MESELKQFQDQLPPDWKVKRRVTQLLPGSGPISMSKTTIEVESERHNVIIEGRWEWIMERVMSYTLSGR